MERQCGGRNPLSIPTSLLRSSTPLSHISIRNCKLGGGRTAARRSRTISLLAFLGRVVTKLEASLTTHDFNNSLRSQAKIPVIFS